MNQNRTRRLIHIVSIMKKGLIFDLDESSSRCDAVSRLGMRLAIKKNNVTYRTIVDMGARNRLG